MGIGAVETLGLMQKAETAVIGGIPFLHCGPGADGGIGAGPISGRNQLDAISLASLGINSSGSSSSEGP